ncbi:hypothetical protein G4Y79_09560 [Phototrophicus methaneseepsis]|uniref:Uncharacterized protein n=1 Tax=Phototrophicus methaneseepsis TaxID=2710758 RepID=A0A7S8ECT2_9CHLR|nr:hypothetical protein [Phototrophicus methaneseepsis]QPC84602.1 hypothetical protein G4Y79_09560 [Phototrophicus methaneseepsis]
MTDRPYLALRILGALYLLSAALVLFVGVLSGIDIIMESADIYYFPGALVIGMPTAILGFSVIFISFLISLGLAAFGQIIQVVLEILQNNRYQTKYLRVMTRQQAEEINTYDMFKPPVS